MSTHLNPDELPEDLKRTHEEIEQAKRELRDEEPSNPVGDLLYRDPKPHEEDGEPQETEPS